jgi:hypothetical protein
MWTNCQVKPRDGARSLVWGIGQHGTHQLCLWGVSNSPHLYLVKPEVLLGRQLRAVVRGAPGLGLAVSFPEISIYPKPEVTVLPTHALRRKPRQS